MAGKYYFSTLYIFGETKISKLKGHEADKQVLCVSTIKLFAFLVMYLMY